MWRRRSGILGGKQVHRLLTRENVWVIHDYMGDVRLVPPAERVEFWNTIADGLNADKFSAYYGVEFVDEKGRSLLVVHEDC